MIKCRWDEQKCREIAKATGVKQTIKDVSFASFYAFHKGALYVLLSEGEFFLVGYFKKNALRIIGIAVVPKMQGKGIGKKLLNRAKLDCIKKGINRIETRSASGCEFYVKNGFDVIDYYDNGDYKLKFEFK